MVGRPRFDKVLLLWTDQRLVPHKFILELASPCQRQTCMNTLCSIITPGQNQDQDHLYNLLTEGTPLGTAHSQCVGPEVSTLGCASLPVTSLLPFLYSSKCRQEGFPVSRMAGPLRQRGSEPEQTWQGSRFTSTEELPTAPEPSLGSVTTTDQIGKENLRVLRARVWG